MIEPDILNEPILCAECEGTGAVYAQFPGSPVDLEPPEGWEECPTCAGNGFVRLKDLEAA